MSELKITGNPNPTVGKLELYSVNQLQPSKQPNNPLGIPMDDSFVNPVLWSVHILENGRWRKTKENDKVGTKVSYTFLQQSLERKGIRIIAQKGEQTARIDIKTHKAESPKIDSIEFLNKQGQKPSKPLAYGQTLKARVHCLHMERRTVYATLWEDDDKSKENNKIETRFGTVIDGIVDIDFTLRPSAAKARLNKDTTHKYFVTTVVNNKNMPSNPVNVKELEVPVPPYKKKTPIQQPNTPTAPISTNNGVGNVYITDINGQPVKGTFKSKKLKVWIESKGLQGKEIKLTIYDEDLTTNDLIYHNNFKITKDLYGIEVHLDKLPVSKAGRLEGDIELFVDIEVLQNQTHTKSGVVNVDAKAFKQDSGAIVNTVLKVFDPSGEKDDENKNKSCGEKYCIKKGDKSELIREINIRLAGFGGNVPTDEFTENTEKMIKQFQKDYMKVPETGKICGNVLKAIDGFCDKYIENVEDYKCPCQNSNNSAENEKASVANRCSEGWGKGLYSAQYMNASINEPYRKYEYPGMHRSTLWAVSAMKFYLDFTKSRYKKYDVNRGYRCWADNNFHNRHSTNHFGKAADIRFTKDGARTYSSIDSNKIRESIFNKYLNAKWWGNPNFFTLEKESDGAVTYVHVDCRDFSIKYMDNKYFVKNQINVKGKSIVQLAKDLGFNDTCSCLGGKTKTEAIGIIGNRVDPKTLKLSQKGIDFIKSWEKFVPNLYDDDSDEHHCTIGYGHLVHRGRCNGSESEEFKRGIDKARATELFNGRLIEFENAVKRDITVNLYQHEYDALVSLVFNSGSEFLNIGGANNGETKIKKNINNKNYEAGADEMSDVTNHGLPGLVARRKSEINIFKNKIYEMH
jgi:GH24 family phage-related lysozyme (muramidase)